MKTQSFEKKKQTFHWKKIFWPTFSCNIECEKPEGTIFKGQKRYSDIYGGSYKIISLGPKRMLKTKCFWKKGNLSSE